MSYRVIIEEPAQAEMEDVLRWMAQHSPEAAALWHFDLTEAIESFQNSPRSCPLAYENEEFDEEIRHLIFGKYRILFTIRDESVYVLHVRHSARKPLKRQDGS